ncbi:MAG: threonine synthase [Limnochordia bacterium]|jgi:threonine synthase
MNENVPWPGINGHHRQELPLDQLAELSLGEGKTPLLPARRLAEAVSFSGQLFIKNEGLNPTGSYKDRGMAVAVAAGLQAGSNGIVCPSLGNAGASAAAYAARAGLPCIIIVPEDVLLQGGTLQAQMYKALVVAVQGSYEDCLELARLVAENHGYTLINSLNPYYLEGQKTLAYEIWDQMSQPPDYVALPIGEGACITALWQGFKEYQEQGRSSSSLPRMLGFQGRGADPLLVERPIDEPASVAGEIRVGNPAHWQGVLDAVEESGGLLCSVSDSEIMEAYRLLASLEGVFCELTGVVATAGILKLMEQRYFPPQARIVIMATGHGLKDLGGINSNHEPPVVVNAEITQIEKVLNTWRSRKLVF